MSSFSAAHAITMVFEGGYANNPADTGGETYKGIARNHNPNWPGWSAVDAATRQTKDATKINAILAKNALLQQQVLDLYKKNYWDAIRLDSIASDALTHKLYDIAVNMGVGRSAKLWQEALNLTNSNGRAYPDIVIDGIVGPQTVALTNNHPRPKLLLQVLSALQAERYLNIMRASPSQETFAASWFNRV